MPRQSDVERQDWSFIVRRVFVSFLNCTPSTLLLSYFSARLTMLRTQLRRSAARAAAATTRTAATRSFASTAARPAEVELTIDGKKVSIEAGSALIQACEKAGSVVPRYCYHEYV
jgi:hypothetical protein